MERRSLKDMNMENTGKQDPQEMGASGADAVQSTQGPDPEEACALQVTAADPVPARLAALRRRMEAEGVDACIVPTGDPHMSEYISDHYQSRQFITGFTGSAGTAIITMDDAGLWTDSRYFLQAEDELAGSGITLYRMGLPETQTQVSYLREHLPNGSTVCVDGRMVGAAWAERLRKGLPGIRLLTDADLPGDIWKDRPELTFREIRDYPLKYAGVSRSEKVAQIRADLGGGRSGAGGAQPDAAGTGSGGAGSTRSDADGAGSGGAGSTRSDAGGAGSGGAGSTRSGSSRSCVQVISGLSDIAWLLNLRGNDIQCNPVFFAFALLSCDRLLLFAEPSCISAGLTADLQKDGVEIFPYDEFYDHLARLDVIFDAPAGSMLVRLDPQTCSERIVHALPEGCRIVYQDSSIMLRKCIKNPVEMAGIRSAHLKDGVAMCKFICWLKKAVAEAASGPAVITEISAAKMLHEFRSQQELFCGDSFDAIVGYGPHGAIVHYSATEESDLPLQPEGLVLIDSGGQYLDGTTDVTRTIALGPLTDWEQETFTAVLRGHIDLARARFPYGLNGANLDYLAHAPLWELGLDYRHGTGHGVGHYLNVHEDPNRIHWSTRSTGPAMPAFEEGMLTSDEPGYYEAGQFGIRHESLLLCMRDAETEYGQFMRFEEVTLAPFDLDGILPERMQPDEIEYLNAYHEMVYQKISPYLDEDEKAWLREATAAIAV